MNEINRVSYKISALTEHRQRENIPNLLMCFFFAAALVCSPLAEADEKLRVNASNSEVGFSGEHVGMVFKGIFKKWNAELTLPPAESPKIIAIFEVASASTGDSTYDSTLPEGDWFDVDNHPQGKFESTEVVSTGKGYAVKGNLTLRGISKPVSFMLLRTGKKLESTFDINRLDYKIGFESDPKAEWVSPNIKMSLSLSLK